ncbi:unnamed protein product, partial [marine sediment metagenome]
DRVLPNGSWERVTPKMVYVANRKMKPIYMLRSHPSHETHTLIA